MEQKPIFVLHTVQMAWLLVSLLVIVAAQVDINEDVETMEAEFCDAGECTEKITESPIVTRSSYYKCFIGHHPTQKCTIHHVMLDKKAKSFKTYNSPDSEELFTTWNIINTNEPFTCDRNVKHGFVFLFYYYRGHSNYFHLHYDTLIPLYSQLRDYMVEGELSNDVVLMPSVETSRLEVSVCSMLCVCNVCTCARQSRFLVSHHHPHLLKPTTSTFIIVLSMCHALFFCT